MPRKEVPWHQRVISHLQRSPGLRGTIYLAGAVGAYEIARPFYINVFDHATEKFHLTVFPMIAALTYGFTRLEAKDNKVSADLVLKRMRHAAIGAGIGGTALASTFAVMKVNGWLSSPVWGWEQHELSKVAGSVLLSLIGHAAVAWNEEQVFRGYGYSTLRQIMPPAATLILLSVLFGFYHGFDVRRAMAFSVAGLTLGLLRIQSGEIWLSFGFHWAWNVMQSAIFGPDTATPSVRPVSFHGPKFWIGSPNQPELGALAVIAMLLIGGTVAWQLWNEQQKQLPEA